MNEMLQKKGGDVPSISQGGQFHTMDQEGLVIQPMAKQQEVEITFDRREPKI